jgi:hypothetical protein
MEKEGSPREVSTSTTSPSSTTTTAVCTLASMGSV